MADTVRTRTELAALFADNASGDISAQDLRDFLASVRMNAWRGARVALSANQSIANNTIVPISWETEAEDTDNFWSLASPTRLVIPTGVTRVRVTASIYFATNSTGLRQISIKKNGADFAGMGMMRVLNSSAQTGIQCITADVAVSAGDYFEAHAVQSSGGALNVEAQNQTWFGIDVIEASN